MGTVDTRAESTDGVTVGLIDAVITICGVLSGRDRTSPTVREALKSLAMNADVVAVMRDANRSANLAK